MRRKRSLEMRFTEKERVLQYLRLSSVAIALPPGPAAHGHGAGDDDLDGGREDGHQGEVVEGPVAVAAGADRSAHEDHQADEGYLEDVDSGLKSINIQYDVFFRNVQ